MVGSRDCRPNIGMSRTRIDDIMAFQAIRDFPTVLLGCWARFNRLPRYEGFTTKNLRIASLTRRLLVSFRQVLRQVLRYHEIKCRERGGTAWHAQA